MIILGIDPGTICTGYGIINFNKNEISYIHSGIIKPKPKLSIAQRLDVIYSRLIELIDIHNPSELSLETAFYGKNVQSALKIGYARGISLLAAIHNNLHIGEYSPREIKKSITGNGNATKDQVQYMVFKLLSLRKKNMSLDESDALAVSVCHAFKSNSMISKAGNWKSFIKLYPERIARN